ncbi:diacylglycerol kinase family protein [Bacteroides sp. 214]|uniref:diacylglycerol kinase family protein n=1 Tax=Bacteroides sp. 214 TaxID=2302935 RepID=UPI0013D59D59|nr:diacylglycerol kinase family protein [Bacteroides sp. 214]NDW12812.1 diacylglycerol kinase family protein [Bacteroides sp. 214]
MNKPFRLKDRLRSFVYAWQGIIILIRNEHNAWIHLFAVITVTALGFIFSITATEWIAVILCFGLVLAAEAFNTAIEKFVDHVSTEHHPILGKVKDLAAGAVLICAIAAAIVGLIIFLPYIMSFFALNQPSDI